MPEQDTAAQLQCHQYQRRWLMLAIFILCSASNSMHWLQYSIIANIMTRYYNVSNGAINWTSMIYMLCYIPFVFPASWVLDRKVSRYWHKAKIILILNKHEYPFFAKDVVAFLVSITILICKKLSP
jgi:MFS family permease